jgi:outer membrane biosynthesis protein TonB
MTEALPSALEPELRRIIDTAVARVAAIELEAIREARELTQRSEQEARDALRFALDRAFNLINTLELLAATVGGMAEALKIELDDAIAALRSVPEPESELAKELAAAATQEPAPVQEAPPVPEPEPEPEPEPTAPPEPVPAAELEQPEAVEPEAVKAAEPQAQEEPAEEEPVRVRAAQSNGGYPPAERQAESLAAATAHEPEGDPSADGAPAVPARRRGLMRRLFSK